MSNVKTLSFADSFKIPKRDPELPYKTEKAEVHPNPVGNGQSTIEFLRDSFAMTGREVDKSLIDRKTMQ